MTTFPPNKTSAHILLVDQETPSRDAAGQILRTHGFQPRSAINRHEALGAIREESIELAIVNILLPGAEGIATTLGILASAPTMKIIALVGESAQAAGLARSLGACALKGDPVDGPSLINMVRELLLSNPRQVA